MYDSPWELLALLWGIKCSHAVEIIELIYLFSHEVAFICFLWLITKFP